jgi:methylated-DNA-[protein]-cysteine S-methyltransferase
MVTMSEAPVSAAVVAHTTITTSLGELTVVARGGVVTGIYFPHHWHRPDPAGLGGYRAAEPGDVFDDVRRQLGEYLAGERRDFDLAVETAGGAFQQRVWDRLRQIPYGTTVTYGELARELGGGVMAQEVGAAVGRNPVSIVVPCHRVVGADGTLTGYAGGLDRKRTLLDLEQDVAGHPDRLF